MAKTKLIAAVETSMTALAAQLKVINDSCDNFSGFDDADFDKLETRYEAAKVALQALGTHLNNLQRRENNATVGDKLRSLKNVFKDKKDLSAKRKAAKDRFDQHQKLFDTIENDILTTKAVMRKN